MSRYAIWHLKQPNQFTRGFILAGLLLVSALACHHTAFPFPAGANGNGYPCYYCPDGELVPPTVTPASHLDNLLWWAPPALTDPITIEVVPIPYDRVLRLEPEQDYIIKLPNQPVERGLIIHGGRHVVLIGGEISIPWQGENADISRRTGLRIVDTTGTVHIEGLRITGPDLTEGIQVSAPYAIVQLQNVRIEDIHARDEVNFSDNHPDLIQTYGGLRELRVDRVTGSTDYQGFFFKSDGVSNGPIYLSRVNIVGMPTARYLMWFEPRTQWGDIYLWEVWLDVPEERARGLGDAVWPNDRADAPYRVRITRGARDNEIASWPDMDMPHIYGQINEGPSPWGDFAPSDKIGIGYTSPGYQTD